jgi:hypothetical protein
MQKANIAIDITDPHMEIAKLGNDSWELVSLAQIQSPDARVYYFKRPKNS